MMATVASQLLDTYAASPDERQALAADVEYGRTLNRHVYFVRAGADGPIKIGSAWDLAHRLVELQDGNPDVLVLVATVPGTTFLERALHRAFAESHIRGGWFAATPRLLRLLAVLEASQGRPSDGSARAAGSTPVRSTIPAVRTSGADGQHDSPIDGSMPSRGSGRRAA